MLSFASRHGFETWIVLEGDGDGNDAVIVRVVFKDKLVDGSGSIIQHASVRYLSVTLLSWKTENLTWSSDAHVIPRHLVVKGSHPSIDVKDTPGLAGGRTGSEV